MNQVVLRTPLLGAFAFVLASCGGGGGGAGMGSTPMTAPLAGNGSSVPIPSATAATLSLTSALPASLTTDNDDDGDDNVSILDRLKKIVTIGSTVAAGVGEQNPYGLDIAKSSAGKIDADDLVVCNFNDSGNVQGTGSSIVVLHPRAGSTPLELVKNPSLLGCNALALAPNDNIWAAAFAANDNPIVSPAGSVLQTLAGGPWHAPFGQTFADNPYAPAFYESNAGDGSIVRINLRPGHFTFDVIAKGFAVNGGAPGSILGPSGLQYDARHDRLFVVDGTNDTVVVLRHVSLLPAGAIVVNPGGKTFGGHFAPLARLVFAGAPLNGPISSALLPNGHLVIGNTLDPNGTNLMVELTPRGRVLATKNVDTGAAGALFGMVASGTGESETKLYFNDDNDNTVKVLTQ